MIFPSVSVTGGDFTTRMWCVNGRIRSLILRLFAPLDVLCELAVYSVVHLIFQFLAHRFYLPDS